MKLSFDRNHQIFNCFRNSFRNSLLCCCQSAEKVRCCKAFQGFCDHCARKFSRPPRYDRFDTSPYDIQLLFCNCIAPTENKLNFCVHNSAPCPPSRIVGSRTNIRLFRPFLLCGNRCGKTTHRVVLSCSPVVTASIPLRIIFNCCLITLLRLKTSDIPAFTTRLPARPVA